MPIDPDFINVCQKIQAQWPLPLTKEDLLKLYVA